MKYCCSRIARPKPGMHSRPRWRGRQDAGYPLEELARADKAKVASSANEEADGHSATNVEVHKH